MRLAFSLVLLLFSSLALCKSGSACEDVEEVRVSFDKLWEMRTSESQNAFLKCASEAWHYYENEAKVQDAEFRYTVSTFLMSSLQFNSDNFFKMINEDKYLFRRWLEFFPNGIFTWFNDGDCEYTFQIKKINQELNNVEHSTKQLDAFKEFSKISKTLTCHVID